MVQKDLVCNVFSELQLFKHDRQYEHFRTEWAILQDFIKLGWNTQKMLKWSHKRENQYIITLLLSKIYRFRCLKTIKYAVYALNS